MPRYFKPINKEDLIQKILEAAAARNLIEKHLLELEMGETVPLGSEGDPEVSQLMSISHYSWKDLTARVKEDLSKIEFDLENVFIGKCYQYDMQERKYTNEPDTNWPNKVMGLVTLENGLTFLGLVAGGDWECSLFFMIYWDGKQLRGYIPREGNPYNSSTKEAYGNADEADDEVNAKKRFGTIMWDTIDIQEDVIIADILQRIQLKQ
jgi:hypothetical protein